MKEHKLVVFEDKKIRRIWYTDEWFFSVIDIVEVLTESARARKYWSELKMKLIDEGFEVSDIIGRLKIPAPDGKLRLTDCANTKNVFRIIQSIPSKKAEPFKQWLAKVGYERVQEIENPELAHDRAKKYYEMKGYSDSWIDKRLRGIAVRHGLTDEWKSRDIKRPSEFAILTDEIARATFDVTTKEHKVHKGLDPKFKNQNLRDNMTELELIFGMLGEASTKEITKTNDSQGLDRCKSSAKEGGDIAGRARKDLEKSIGRSVVSKEMFVSNNEKKQLE